MSSQNGDKYVNWKVFTWVISMIIVALGGIFSIIFIMKADVAVIKTDINYIKEGIVEIKNTPTANIGMIVPENTANTGMQVPENQDFRDKVFAEEETVYNPNYTPEYP